MRVDDLDELLILKKTQRFRKSKNTLLSIINGILLGSPHTNFENSVFKDSFLCILEA